MLNDTARAADALHAIPPDLPRDEWVKVGMAYHATGGDFVTFDNWSNQADNYSAADCRGLWKSLKKDGGIGAGTLYQMAREHGWSEGKASQAPSSPIERPRKPAQGMAATDIWSRCEAATNAHGYIVAKRAAGVPLDALRVVPAGDALVIAGQSMAGYLMIPAYAPNGEMQTAQFIPPPGAGKKVNLPGASMAGATFSVGPTDGPAHLCEGIGAAWSVFQATGQRAVVCFGWGNVRRVAEAMRQQDPAAKLILWPDSGKELDAEKIAADVGATIAAMPPGEPDNFDANDLGQRDGLGVLTAILHGASEPPKPETGEVLTTHPLNKFVDVGDKAKPPRWVIPGFIGHGVTVISGGHGVGKTTALLPLAMTVAGLHGSDLMPRQWRHVIFITEDVEQALRILGGILQFGNLSINPEAVRERLHIVEAVRLDPAFVATVGSSYRAQFCRNVDGVEVLPLVVLDTKSAVLTLENENDNSEVSAMMAALKQGFDGLPVWLIGHVAKANLNRNDALTGRGAGSLEGDANQTLFLIREANTRYLVQGKTRFESSWPELEITSYTAQTLALDEFGNPEAMRLRWGICNPAKLSRKETAKRAAEQQSKQDEASLRQEIRDAVEVAWLTGHPLNRAALKAKVRRKTSSVLAMIENLLSERWLYEVTVPAKVRAVNSKAAFLVNLSVKEHEAFLSDGLLPADKSNIPASWKKQEIPLVPVPDCEIGAIDYAHP